MLTWSSWCAGFSLAFSRSGGHRGGVAVGVAVGVVMQIAHLAGVDERLLSSVVSDSSLSQSPPEYGRGLQVSE